MRKIKIFTNTNSELLELDINNWFEKIEDDGLEIIETYQSQSFNTYTLHDDVTITFVYKDSKVVQQRLPKMSGMSGQSLSKFSAPDLGNIKEDENESFFNFDF